MLLARAVSLGGGKMKKAAKDRTWNEWNKLANGGKGALKPGLKDAAALFGFPILEEKNE